MLTTNLEADPCLLQHTHREGSIIPFFRLSYYFLHITYIANAYHLILLLNV